MEKLLNAHEVAELLGLRISTIYKFSMAGKLPTVKINGSLRFSIHALERYIEEHSREPIKKAVAAAG